MADHTREFCIERRGVLCPEFSKDPFPAGMDWQSPTKCLWDAPANFTSMRPIKHIWEPVAMTLSPHDRINLEQFFRRTLLIEDLTGGHVVEELRYVSELFGKYTTYPLGPKCLHDMYRKLDELRKGMDESLLLVIKYVCSKNIRNILIYP